MNENNIRLETYTKDKNNLIIDATLILLYIVITITNTVVWKVVFGCLGCSMKFCEVQR